MLSAFNIAKRVMAIVGLAVAGVSLVATGALAYRVVADIAEVTVTMGKVEVQLMQRSDANGSMSAFEGASYEVERGYSSTNDIHVLNTADEPVWVRVRVCQHAAGSAEAITDGFAVEWAASTTGWVAGSDGWHYYTKKLYPAGSGEGYITPAFLTSLTVAPDPTGKAYEGKDLILTVEVQAVQSKHNGTSVFDATGWND